MTSNHHTPITGTALVNATNTNAPYSELDSAITDMLAGDDAFTEIQVGSTLVVSTQTEYADSNQDAYASLQGGDGAGAVLNINASGGTVPLGDNGGAETLEAQSFQPTAGLFTAFAIELGANSNSPTGDITWTLEGDSSGPDGNVLATGTFTPVASSINTINVPEADWVFLAASTTYWITFEVPAQSTNNYYRLVASTSSVYANGQRASSTNGGASWALDSTRDLALDVTTIAIDFGEQLAQGFQISSAANATTVKVWLRGMGSPTGNLTVELQTDSSGDPSGTPVTNGTSAQVAASSLTDSFAWVEFTFSTPPALSASTQYHLVLKTTAAQSNTNFVVWGTDESSPTYANGELKSYNGASWDAESDDGCFTLEGTINYAVGALLRFFATDKGVLLPRLTTAQRDLLTPPNGTIIFNTTTGVVNYYNGSWTALAASAANAPMVELIAPTSVIAQASVSIDIPSGYRDVLIRLRAKSNAGGTPWEMLMQLNSDTGSNYRYTVRKNSDGTTHTPANSQSGIEFPIGDSADDYWEWEIWLYNYTDTGDYRGVNLEGMQQTDDSMATNTNLDFAQGMAYWQNTADAISSVQLKENNSSTWTGSYAVYGLI